MSEPTAAGLRPLSGLRVLDLSRVLAGPYCCAMLAEQGAEVIKVERPGQGDENRLWGHLLQGVGVDYLNVNRGKRGITVNLQHRQGQEVIRRLAADTDVLVENFVADATLRYGLTYEDLSEINPRLIYCSISAYGDRGPMRGQRGYDGAMQAFTGHMSITGEPGGAPVRSGASVLDMSTGIATYGAVLTALLARASTGRGQRICTSLLKTALALMGTHGAAYLNAGVLPQRAGSGVSHLAPYGAYRTLDGYVVIGVLNDASWRRLCRQLGLAQLPADPRFSDMQARVLHRRELDAVIEDVVSTQATAYWCALLEKAGIVVAPVNTLEQAMQHAQVAQNAMVGSVGEGERRLRLVSGPMDFGQWQPAMDLPPPLLGEHTDQVLGEIGYSNAEIAGLRASGAI
ncbi:CoA transferase [Verticiella sediminum]|uniref:CoA transferase n=1 Tax=Verticiella sediminum TaxID=1247510 RepID=A0A556AGM3_9BURK|nr:CoA transferase [Verticiella sediminum]TSH92036.1 CoA transferase [Verticiella sediminum]